MKNYYPTLLIKKATIFGTLKRTDLMILGSSYLIFSLLKINSLMLLFINIFLFVFIKIIEKNFKRGFFENLMSCRVLHWQNELNRWIK